MTEFLERKVPIGDSEALPFEMALVVTSEGTLVVLRETRTQVPRTPVLTACFEYIATVVHVEVAHVRRLPLPLRFFHCRYELAAGKVSWSLREVLMHFRDDQYSMAQWKVPDEATLEQLNASLNLSESPARLL